MNNELRKAKQSIRSFIRANFSDQRLHEVIAFNDDGKMRFTNSCCCLMGVTLSGRLHEWRTECEDPTHYYWAQSLFGAVEAEQGYGRLAFGFFGPDAVRRRRLAPILKAEARRRARFRQGQESVNISVPDAGVLVADR